MYGLAILIAKDNVRRNRLIEALRDAHFAQNGRWARLLRVHGNHEQRHRCNNKPRFVSCDQGFPLPFGADFAASAEVPVDDALGATGSPCFSNISIARSMGTRTVPSSRFSQE